MDFSGMDRETALAEWTASPKHLAERFYHQVWNQADEGVAREILHADVHFRGSLGAVEHGPEGFISYLRLVHAALSGYTCTILEMIEEGSRVAARLCFSGFHTGVFLGASPTGRKITWDGAAFFVTDRGKIREVWVLGDLEALKRQLAAGAAGGV